MKNSNKREIVDVIAINEIIDDAGLVLCINRLNALKEPGNDQQIYVDESLVEQKRHSMINRTYICAEMRWFTQWVTEKMKFAA